MLLKDEGPHEQLLVSYSALQRHVSTTLTSHAVLLELSPETTPSHRLPPAVLLQTSISFPIGLTVAIDSESP